MDELVRDVHVCMSQQSVYIYQNSPKKVRADWLKIICKTRWRHRTCASCLCSDGATTENLHFDNQS